MTLIEQFAENFRLQLQIGVDEDNTTLPGQRGEILTWDSETLAAYINFNWVASRTALVKDGCKVLLNGDKEGVLSFDHNNKLLSDKVIFHVRCYGLDKPKKPPVADKNSGAAQLKKPLIPIRPITGK